ncbi:MAG: hypothetical protein E7437_04635 [Ruminococcaceae bacterium]|nr:hypothetical protein [Oscillospiraceae bacterium]
MTVAEKLITIADNTPLVANAVNAARTTVSGPVIRVDDVLASEHPVKVQLRSKNLFNIMQLRYNTGTSYVNRLDNGDIRVDCTTSTSTGVACGSTLTELAPALRAGETYTISGTSDIETRAYIYLQEYGRSWSFGTSLTMTDTILNSKVFFYSNAGQINYVHDLMIVHGTATPDAFSPYMDDFSGVSVAAQGKNLLSAMSKWNALPQENAQPIFMKAGQKYTFSHNGEYTAWRLMFYGTEADGSALPIDPDITASQLSGVYIDSTYATNSGNRPRIQYAANLTGSHHVIRCKKDFTVTAIQLWVTGEEITPCTQFQLELGAAATAYTPYEPAQIAEADETGKVRGLQSMSPTMTLTPADPAVTVECGYFPQSAAATYESYQKLKAAMIL